MSELTITLMRLGLLVLLWVFVFAIVAVLRGDLYGTRVVARRVLAGGGARRQAAPAPTRSEQREKAKAARVGSRRPSRLVVTEGPLTGTTLPLRESGTLVGRNPECALVLDDDYASGRHLRIFRAEHGWMAEDLGSTNGTWLGGQRLTAPAPVGIGSALRIGKTVVELQR